MKSVLVTGAGSGLGKQLAFMYANKGYKVFAADFSEPKLQAIKHENIVCVLVDISDSEKWNESVIPAIESHGGKLDIVIACAALLKVGNIENCSLEDWNMQNNINLTGQFLTAKKTIKYLVESKGNIIFIGSPSAKLATRDEVCYITFKHALCGLSKSIAFDYSGKGVRCNVIHPGWMRTEMSDMEMQEIMEKQNLSLDGAYEFVTRFVPMKRAATLEEIGNSIMYLTSENASYITGAELMVDGGLSIVDPGMFGFL